ncbi:arginine--tRNA ligase [Candidatus Magnetominusculus dajiuhuensis]|uniref:arginine--tRNA ligase n=1 Tax=Candidatus Magnetominusculus dajiuhuensis TaxID=3137712 RepID=UPI003B42B439
MLRLSAYVSPEYATPKRSTTMIEDILIKALKKIGIETDFVEVEIPRHEALGDISTPVAMLLSKKLRKSPALIAESIIAAIDAPDIFQTIERAGAGFINFRFKPSYLYGELKKLYTIGRDYLRPNVGKGRKIQIEFVSANPTGPLHLGHGRGAALGAAVANLLSAAGFSVTKEFYVNDAGRQVKLLGESVFARYKAITNTPYDFPADGYHGDYVDELAKEVHATYGDKFSLSGFDEVAQFFIDYSYKTMLSEIKQDLSDFGVEFDRWQSERELFSDGTVTKAIERLRDMGFIYKKDWDWDWDNVCRQNRRHRRDKGYNYKKDSAVWFKATAFGDEKDRVIIKTDGQYTYFASDIAYHVLKLDRGFDEIINIWGADHHGYIPRIRAVIQAAGHDENKLVVLLVQMVMLLRGGVPVQMSKRAGEFVTLRDVTNEVGKDITRFIFLTRRPDSQLEFDMEAVKKESPENPVYYIQYAYARINSVFGKARERQISLSFGDGIDLSWLSSPEELQLIKKLIFYPTAFLTAVRTREPHRITFYLQELAGQFHPFYYKHRILDEAEPLTRARLMLCACVKIVIKEGLNILGVSTPDKM